MRIAHLFALSATLVVTVACTPEVIVFEPPAESTPSGSGGGGSTDPSGGGEPAPRYDALAFEDGGSTGTTVASTSVGSYTSVQTTGGNGGFDDEVELVLGTPFDTQTCTYPEAVADCGAWRVELSIPRSAVQEGVVISLKDTNSYMTVTGQNAGAPPGDCWWGGGSFWDGEVEILAVTEDAIEVELRDTSNIDFDADGVYLARRCAY